MTITIVSGETKDNLTISSGNPLIVLSGGTVGTSTILSGGSATLSSGANGIDLTVSQGGVLRGLGDLDGPDQIAGLVSGVTLAENADVDLLAGGTARDVTVAGLLSVEAGATAIGTVGSAGNVAVYGSASDGVFEDADESVVSGGVVSGDVFQSNSFLSLDSGAVAVDETVDSGGYFTFGGTLSKSFTLQSSLLTSTETLSGVTVSSGGTITLQYIAIPAGVTLSLDSGAQAYFVTVSKGGVVLGSKGELLEANYVAGSISGVSIINSGTLELASGGSASAVTLDGAEARVNFGASAAGTIVETDAALHVLGSEADASLMLGGVEVVYSGGVASGDAVQADSREVVSSGGVASGVNLSSGGLLFVLNSATAAGTVVSSGGEELVVSGGLARADTVLSRGVETIASGGFAIGLTVSSGGVLVDDGELRVGGAGALDGKLSGSGAIVQTEAGDLVLSGAGTAFSGRAVIEAGVIELATAGALGTGSVQFVEPTTGSAVLQIDAADAPAAGGTFANTLTNFNSANEDIDLRSIAFVAGASATVVGSTLVLHDGGQTYTFNIAGGAAGAYPVLSDGHGGTLIDPEVVAFGHTAAAFAPLNAAQAALVSGASAGGLTPFLHATTLAGAGRM